MGGAGCAALLLVAPLVAAYQTVPPPLLGAQLRERDCVVALWGGPTRLLDRLQHAFGGEPHVGLIHVATPGSSSQLPEDGDDGQPRLEVYPPVAADMTCLLPPPIVPRPRTAVRAPSLEVAAAVEFVNRHCGTSRDEDGQLTARGASVLRLNQAVRRSRSGEARECDRVDAADLAPATFVERYVLRNEPVVIRGAASNWSALHRWDAPYLSARAGDHSVHVKVSPDGSFEGVEPLLDWPDSATQYVPPHVLWRLRTPDLVLARPAGVDMPLAQLLSRLNGSAGAPGPHGRRQQDPSFYVEYLSLRAYLPELLGDVDALPRLARRLRLERDNIWIGNGRTVGKLHFDAFENLLTMVRGAKHLTLIPPDDNRDLYEGHLREGMYEWDAGHGAVRRGRLQESTSMVNSPVELKDPDLQRFPRFAKALARSRRCSVREGETLYLPAFWWHEVDSEPGSGGLNIAVNYWYSPVFDKPFPCAHCALGFNERRYAELLDVQDRPQSA